MKQSLTFGLATKSENHFRRGNPRVHHAMNAAQKRRVTELLDEHMIQPPWWSTSERGTVYQNCWQVTLVRISSGELDGDNHQGAMKHVRDAVARWIGVDDADRRISWVYEQESGPRGKPGVRITIDDGRAEGGEHATILERLARPARVARAASSPARAAGARGRKRAGARGVAARATPDRSVCHLPWGKLDEAPVVADIPELDGMGDPPRRVKIRGPKNGEAYHLSREAKPQRVDGDLVWLYRGAGDPVEAAS